ncbi:Mhc Class I Polypeptide-Related Sequence B [Manis pentadactyla]|nr:Mhc Class I Polypeptide-Related Sequence B [Manis pentadactyla]
MRLLKNEMLASLYDPLYKDAQFNGPLLVATLLHSCHHKGFLHRRAPPDLSVLLPTSYSRGAPRTTVLPHSGSPPP